MRVGQRLSVIAPIGVLIAGVALAQGDDFLKKADAFSPEASLTQAREYSAKMQETQNRIRALQDKARKKRDVLMLNCVNDKMVQAGGLLAVASQSMEKLSSAISRNDDGARKHEFTRMTILYQKVVVLGTEAENCVGEDASYVGATKVEIEVDPNIPDEDPTQPQLPLPDVSRPPEASPIV